MIATLHELDEEALIDILTKPKNALVKQYQKLFEMEGVQLRFTEGALRAVARQALARKAGARGLRAILEDAMLDIMYDVPSRDDVEECVISEEVIEQGSQAADRAQEGGRIRLERASQERCHGHLPRTTASESRGPQAGGADERARSLPLLPLRDIIVFPHMVVPLFVGREKSISALEEAMAHGREILLCAQREAGEDEPADEDIFRRRHGRHDHPAAAPARRHREGAGRGQAARAHRALRPERRATSRARSRRSPSRDAAGVEVEALMRTVQGTFENYVKLNKRIPPEMLITVQTIDEPGAARRHDRRAPDPQARGAAGAARDDRARASASRASTS